ncbi:MAG: single-stranded DNA-binding protein [Candidatus Woesebacteria bacterium]|jgi:single-stranded DNA-binding protein
MSLQLVTIIGNATKDAETKVSKDGVSYVTFRVAVSNGDDKSTFYNVVLFGRYGEVLKDLITKGREVYVTGKVQISDKGYVSVVADHVELLRYPKSKLKEIMEEQEKKSSTKPGRPKKKK